jgi:oligopeptidase B
MRKSSHLLFALATLGLFACCARSVLVPPVAKVVPHPLVIHGETRIDDYFWLKERDNPEVRAYLDAENAYYQARMGGLAGFEDRLFEEIVGRIKKNDDTVPVKSRDYYYYVRFEGEREYSLLCRRKGSLDAPEELILDANLLAEGHEYFDLGGTAVSSGQNILAYSIDTVGRRFYDIHFKDLATGVVLPDRIEKVTGDLEWAEDGMTLFYTRQDPETLRAYQIFRHRLGTDPASDVLVYEEKDETFSVWVSKSKSRAFLFLGSSQTLSTEVRLVPAARPETAPRIVQAREREHEYWVDHLGDSFFIVTNDQAKNFRLMKCSETATGKESWVEVVPARPDVLLEGIELFRDYLVLVERRQGLLRLRVRELATGAEHDLDFGEPAYVAWPMDNREPELGTLRYFYSSLTTPHSVIDYDLRAHTKTLRKQDEIVGGYDATQYATERLSAPARDGTGVPISLVYKKPLARDGSRPLLLDGYGAYGYSNDPYFSSARLSLLDRGVVFAIAHVRGGQELGRPWYEAGRQMAKKNTFNDFIDCAEHLGSNGYGDPKRLYAWGGSAGGLLMGAVTNLRPDLFHGVVAEVPFVDLLTTMLDDSIPLTTAEYDEWGNPNDPAFYAYMRAYSPYDNVAARAYPNLLVTTSLEDSQVQYWEPAKWVAKLRANKTDDNLLLLKTNMAAGHGGRSGRFQAQRDIATVYAFVLHLAGLAPAPH